jgi:glycosyltransferase involved in cell wall biosynthesis
VGQIVLFPGWRSDMETVYRGLDLFALPSLTEGLPMALLEAMSYGVPAVASTVGGCPDVIEQDRSGLLCPPGDQPALQEALKQLLADSSRRYTIGENGYARVTEKYSMNRYVEQFRQLYTHVIGETRP